MAPPMWAFQVENFDPPPHDELVCSICQCVFCEPVEGACRHVYCLECIKKWIVTNRNCPICRKRTRESSLQPVNRIIRNLIMGLTLKCKNLEAGCEQKMTLENCEAHMKICSFEGEECSNGCGKVMLRKDVLKHKQEECPCRHIECNECGLTIVGPPELHNCITQFRQILEEKQKEINRLEEDLRKMKSTVDELMRQRENVRNYSGYASNSGPTSTSNDIDFDDNFTSLSSVDTESEVSSVSSILTQSSVSQVSTGTTFNDLRIQIMEPGFDFGTYEPRASPPQEQARPAASADSNSDRHDRRGNKRRLCVGPFFPNDDHVRRARISKFHLPPLTLASTPGCSTWTSGGNASSAVDTVTSMSFYSPVTPDRPQLSDWLRMNHSVEEMECPRSSPLDLRQEARGFTPTFRPIQLNDSVDTDPEWMPPDSHFSPDSSVQLVTSSDDDDGDDEEEEENDDQAEQIDESLDTVSLDHDDEGSDYEVQVPTPAYELLQRYCGQESDSDPEWLP